MNKRARRRNRKVNHERQKARIAQIHERVEKSVAEILARETPIAKKIAISDPEVADFVEGFNSLYERDIAALEHEISTVMKKADNERRRIGHLLAEPLKTHKMVRLMGQAQTEVKRLSGMLIGLEKRREYISPRDVERLVEQYGDIRLIPRVNSVRVEGENIVVITDTLFGKDHSGTWRRIGRFKIWIQVRGTNAHTFKWENLDGVRDGYDGPPNICNGRAGCVGTEGSIVIDRAVKERDYVPLVAFAVRYPECAGRAGNKTITKWPRVSFFFQVPRWYRKTFGS